MRLVQLIVDLPPGELGFAELVQRLALVVPDATVNATVVAAGDTLAAGLCVAQLALTDGPPDRLVVHAVGGGERLYVGRAGAGAIVVGPDAGWAWSFVADELRELHYLDVVGGDCVPVAVRHVVAGHPHAVAGVVPRERVPSPPPCAIAWIDRAGNLTTTLSRAPATIGERLRVEIGGVTETAIVAGDRLAMAEGELGLAPCSLGWPTRDGGRRRMLELGMRGGSAAERFGHPPTGAAITLAPLDRRRRRRPSRRAAARPA